MNYTPGFPASNFTLSSRWRFRTSSSSRPRLPVGNECWWKHLRAVSAIAWALAALGVSGCSAFKDNPYAGFVVGEVNEDAPQTPAAVLVGDPQVSSRESLINDRMREVDHLETMIRDSKDVSFEPQLRRDLEVMEALSAQLGISFNPAMGATFRQNEELAELRNEVEIAKLRNELERLKNLSQDSPGDVGGDQKPESPKQPSSPEEPDLEAIKAQLATLVAAVDNQLKELQKTVAAGRATESTISISPEDHFEDLNAYRARLRHRQNEVRLDDVHDTGGHALYRLQLTATVLPGEVKNKFAVLDAEIRPVETNDEQIRALYDQWLVELSRRSLRLVVSPADYSSSVQFQWNRVEIELIRCRTW